MAAEILKLSDLGVGFDEIKAQIQAYLNTTQVWKGQLTTQTSTTLVDLISSIGVFDQTKLIRAYEDAFAETAQSNDAIRSITQMQGLRLTRKLPAALSVSMTSPVNVTIPPYTQMTVGGVYYFPRQQIILLANTPSTVEVYQGRVYSNQSSGRGTDFQQWVMPQDAFVISDLDTQVRINGALIPKSDGGLWNFKNQPAYADLTLADGRLLIQFGSSDFGSIPQVTDTVEVSYVVTEGQSGNNRTLVGKRLTVEGFNSISGVVLANPTGGADQKPVVTYKNVASGSFGTYRSGVTRSQYISLVSTYPGIIDAITQAQREINPMDLKWMNTIRISGLTTSPWTQQMKADFIEYMEKITMYSTRFYWQDPIPVDRDVVVDVYCFNTAILSQVQQQSYDAVTDLFAKKPGILMTNFYKSDIGRAITADTAGQVSYIEVKEPEEAMVVTPPPSPNVTWTVDTTGQLSEGIYAYSVAIDTATDSGAPNKWVFPQITSTGDDGSVTLTWDHYPTATQYRVYGRQAGSPSSIGLLTTITVGSTPTPTYTYFDNGNDIPTGGMPNTLNTGPIKYNRLNSLVVNVYYSDRQQKLDGTPERQIIG